ncbi:hypothetical protein [Desulfofalx alkaliphila]|uniref:hypothetical protein n=1 Tax=Desulfofalx alkaliphila TaxID=105483 RepID=UPI0004E1ABDE|nr:hypothetical protein [Desulfofalx alkaliphila]
MQMQPGERSILAYFSSTDDARQAVDALKDMGITEVQIDRISRYGAALDTDSVNPLSGELSQTDLTLFAGDSDAYHSDSSRVMMAADPSVSGFGDTDYGVAGGRSFLVTAVTDEEHLDRAIEIIKQKGGLV